MESTKHHVVCMPFPAQGHINAMLKLAKILHYEGFFITFVNTEFTHRRILKNRGPSALDGLPDFRFATITDGLPDSNPDKSRDLGQLIESITRTGSISFTKLLTELNDPCSGVRPVRCVISDSLTSFTLAATAQMGIPNVFFSSLSACGFMIFLHLKEMRERGVLPLRTEGDLENGYLDTIVDWIPGMRKLSLKEMASFVRNANQLDQILTDFVMNEAQASLKATAIIVHSFHELEGPVIDAFASIQALPPVYDIGPLSLLSQQIPNGDPLTSVDGLNLWREDASCTKWLDGKKPGSVLYVNFGSMVVISGEQLVEFAWGLANSGCEFLWVIRPDLVAGENAVLPKEFSVETGGRSFVAGWCRQEEVLAHAAVGGFLTHCGWNSATESICAGLPMICWPFFGEQPANCKYICSEWGIGVQINEDVKREDVEMLIKEVMQGQKGKEMKRKVLELKERAAAAAKPGGAAWKNLDKVIEEIITK